MGRRILSCVSAVMTVFGSVVGAGFITGREINAFFGEDFSLCGLYAAFLFFAAFFFLLLVSPREGKTEKALSVAVSASNVIISSCMLSALKTLLNPVFRFSENFLFFPVLFGFFAFFICEKGIGGISLFSLVSMPFVIAVLFVVALSGARASSLITKISPSNFTGAAMPALYVGINCVLSSSVIRDLGKGAGKRKAAVVSVASAFIIILFVFLILRAVYGVNSEMPVVTVSGGRPIIGRLVYLSIFFAVFSTLLSSLSSALKLRPKKRKKAWGAVVVFVCVFLSRFSFSDIVGKLYPPIGIFGAVYFIVLIFSSSFFREGRRARTFPPLKRRV